MTAPQDSTQRTKTVKDSVAETQINLINAQNLYIIELEEKIKTLTDLPLPKIMQFKQYYDNALRQLEEFKKKSG